MPANPLLEGLKKHFSQSQLTAMASARVGVAGCGGLGSNVAMLLARSGIGALLLIDFDRVEASNLNRQQFWPEDIGSLKTGALARRLIKLNPALKLETLNLRLTRANLPRILPRCPIWAEALDDARIKAMFVEMALRHGRAIAAASGLCGYGGKPMRVRKFGGLIVAGDFETDVSQAPPLAPRVAQAAALMADAILEFILGMPEPGQGFFPCA